MTVKALGEAEVRTRAAALLPRWSVVDGMLVRRFATHGWQASLLAAGAIAHLAELAWHHPDLLVSFGGVEVRLVTHDAGGIGERDLALAQRIDALMGWDPASEATALTGPPRPSYLKRD